MRSVKHLYTISGHSLSSLKGHITRLLNTFPLIFNPLDVCCASDARKLPSKLYNLFSLLLFWFLFFYNRSPNTLYDRRVADIPVEYNFTTARLAVVRYFCTCHLNRLFGGNFVFICPVIRFCINSQRLKVSWHMANALPQTNVGQCKFIL